MLSEWVLNIWPSREIYADVFPVASMLKSCRFLYLSSILLAIISGAFPRDLSVKTKGAQVIPQ